jgi:hypothetical protein
MKTFAKCPKIQVDALATYLANARGFADRGEAGIYPEAVARQDADTYESDVLNILNNQLATRATSAAVLDAIAAGPSLVRITPVDKLQTQGPQQYMLQNAGATRLPNEPVSVKYTPDAEDHSDGASAGMRYDETLLHELIHALGYSTGQSFSATMGDEFDDEDEFKAILITNVYSSEIGRPLRRDHHGIWSAVSGKTYNVELTGELTDPAKFLDYHNYGDVVDRIVTAHQALCNVLAGLQSIRFNPFAVRARPRLVRGSPFSNQCVR